MENNISVLVIEDEALIAETIKMQLEDFGYGITQVCYKYETALAAIETTDYDIIITDINLGYGVDIKSGIILMQQLKKIRECPFVFLTAFSDRDTLKKATLLYPSAYLVKPVNAASLFAAIQLAMENFENKNTAGINNLGNETMPDYFFAKLGNSLAKIFWKDIYCIEAVKNYVRIKTTRHAVDPLIRGSLQQFLKINMPKTYSSLFIKINRSTAITKEIIIKLNKDTVETVYGSFELKGDLKRDEL